MKKQSKKKSIKKIIKKELKMAKKKEELKKENPPVEENPNPNTISETGRINTEEK